MKEHLGELPHYLQIKEQLQARITRGALQAGDKLPSERELCAIFSTTRVTVRESLAQLEATGAIYRADRRGWFVTPERLWLIRRRTPTSTGYARSRGARRALNCCPPKNRGATRRNATISAGAE